MNANSLKVTINTKILIKWLVLKIKFDLEKQNLYKSLNMSIKRYLILAN